MRDLTRCADRVTITAQAAIVKNFQLTERFKFQFRMDAYNIFNHVALGYSNNQGGGGNCVASLSPRTLAVAVAARFKTSCLERGCVSCSLACICSSNGGVEETIHRRESSGSPPNFLREQIPA